MKKLSILLVVLLLMGCAAPVYQFSADVKDLTVVIDAGHGGFDPGAIGTGTKVYESKINLAIAKKLADLFKGTNVILTREDEEALGPYKYADMQERQRIISESPVDIVVSIHQNKHNDRSVKGAQVFYYPGSAEGEKLAKCIQSKMNEVTGKKRSVNAQNFFVLRAGSAPAVLVECGFLSNWDEENKLKDDGYQQKIAESIAAGIDEYIRTEKGADAKEAPQTEKP